MVARFQGQNALSHLHHHARALMPQNHREQAFGVRARPGELIGVADAGGLDLDQHFAGARPLQIHFFNHQGLARAVGDSARDFMDKSP